MAKIATTATKFKAGIEVAATKTTIQWEPTGHISVRLFDASGTQPLVGRKASVTVPNEGDVLLESDASGLMFHPDVPFQEYALALQPSGKIDVPAVASREEVHRCAVSAVPLGWVEIRLTDERGIPVTPSSASIAGETLVISPLDAGRLDYEGPLPVSGPQTLTIDGKTLDIKIPILNETTVIRLPKKGAER